MCVSVCVCACASVFGSVIVYICVRVIGACAFVSTLMCS